MKQYLLKVAGLAVLMLSINSAGFAQTEEQRDTANGKLRENEEIIIKPKSDKDVTVTVEIKGGQVFVDGRPVDKFDDDNVSVHKKKIMILDGPRIDLGDMDMDKLMGPDGPFRKGGGWSFDGGNANRAFLGVNSVSSDADAAAARGAKIKDVTSGSAAEKAGLKPGDLITRVDEINISNPQDLSNAIHKYKPEDMVTLTFKRDGKEQKTTATLGKSEVHENFNYNFNMPKGEGYNFAVPPMPPVSAMPRAFSWNDGRPKLGIKAQDMEEGKGAKVLDVDGESPADKAGIKEGDIITRFDGKDVDNASMLADLARETAGKSSIRIGVTRDGKTREIEVKVPKKLKTADL